MKTDSAQIQYDKMTKTPVNKLVLQLGLPTTVSMLVTSVYNMADTLSLIHILHRVLRKQLRIQTASQPALPAGRTCSSFHLLTTCQPVQPLEKMV